MFAINVADLGEVSGGDTLGTISNVVGLLSTGAQLISAAIDAEGMTPTEYWVGVGESLGTF